MTKVTSKNVTFRSYFIFTKNFIHQCSFIYHVVFYKIVYDLFYNLFVYTPANWSIQLISLKNWLKNRLWFPPQQVLRFRCFFSTSRKKRQFVTRNKKMSFFFSIKKEYTVKSNLLWTKQSFSSESSSELFESNNFNLNFTIMLQQHFAKLSQRYTEKKNSSFFRFNIPLCSIWTFLSQVTLSYIIKFYPILWDNNEFSNEKRPAIVLTE